MSNPVDNDSSSLEVRMSEIQMGPAGGIQMLFAMLQLAQAGICKDQAEAYMDQIKDTQAKQKEAAEMIALARHLQNKAGEDGEVAMSPELKQYFYENNIKCEGNDTSLLGVLNTKKSTLEEMLKDDEATLEELEKKTDPESVAAAERGRNSIQNTKDQIASLELQINSEKNNVKSFDKEGWDYNIKSLTNYQEQLGTETQTNMVYLQDLMGQYNSFLQGANKAVTDSNQTLQTIATR